jgi:nucleotide-binding universal stress UspA family protein
MLSFRHILVPVDFGESSRGALAVAIDLSKQYESALTLVHTLEIPAYGYGPLEVSAIDMLGPLHDLAVQQLATLLAEVKKERPEAKSVLSPGIAWHEILGAIERLEPDLVVMGTHGRKGIRRMILGSVAESIVRMSPVSVLTVHAK